MQIPIIERQHFVTTDVVAEVQRVDIAVLRSLIKTLYPSKVNYQSIRLQLRGALSLGIGNKPNLNFCGQPVVVHLQALSRVDIQLEIQFG